MDGIAIIGAVGTLVAVVFAVGGFLVGRGRSEQQLVDTMNRLRDLEVRNSKLMESFAEQSRKLAETFQRFERAVDDLRVLESRIASVEIEHRGKLSDAHMRVTRLDTQMVLVLDRLDMIAEKLELPFVSRIVHDDVTPPPRTVPRR